MTYDVTNPASPQYLKVVKAGIFRKEFYLFLTSKMPNNRSLVIVKAAKEMEL
ncbi:hypothetical protein [Flavobacterium piscis]|uniref:Uncharacterized protein n=1 Tax=Flavobacterium piscis TaxID=1114874 RepID=A0ABU1YCQ6_9FLAO|nr:hypothetical protein [Flavobacterium piscis]MDR7212030.1 hypothetical protein [Flavobacterium piscis]